MDEPLQSYDVGEEITLGSWFLSGPTAGTILRGQTLLIVRDDSALDLTVGAPILVEGAGGLGGNLVTTVVSAGAGQVVVADAALTDANRVLVGTPTDPTTVTCTVAKPDGTEAAVSVSSVQTGRWEGVVTPAVDGEFFYLFTGTGAAAATRWRKFLVRPARVP